MARRPVTTLTPALCVAARSFLGWSQANLAEAARLSIDTVSFYERTARPDARRGVGLRSIHRIEATLEDAGFSFTSGPDGEGFMWRKP